MRIPVWPNPASVPQKRSAFRFRSQVTFSPVPVTTSSSRTLSPWVPYLNEERPIPAIARVPPTVTLRLFVRTGGTSCSGPRWRTRSRQITPPSTSTVLAEASVERMRRIEDIARSIPPSLMARRLWLCADPRTDTGSPCSRANATVAATSRSEAGATTKRGVQW